MWSRIKNNHWLIWPVLSLICGAVYYMADTLRSLDSKYPGMIAMSILGTVFWTALTVFLMGIFGYAVIIKKI